MYFKICEPLMVPLPSLKAFTPCMHMLAKMSEMVYPFSNSDEVQMSVESPFRVLKNRHVLMVKSTTFSHHFPGFFPDDLGVPQNGCLKNHGKSQFRMDDLGYTFRTLPHVSWWNQPFGNNGAAKQRRQGTSEIPSIKASRDCWTLPLEENWKSM